MAFAFLRACVYFHVWMLSCDLYITFETQVHISPFQTSTTIFLSFQFHFQCYVDCGLSSHWSLKWLLGPPHCSICKCPCTWAAERACRQFSYANLIDREHIAEEHTQAWDTGSYISLAKFPKKKKLNAKHFDAYFFQPLKCNSVYFSMFSTLWLNVVNVISCAIAELTEGLVFSAKKNELLWCHSTIGLSVYLK